MVAASRRCVPQLLTGKDVMVSNIESAATAILYSTGGVSQYVEYLKKPFSASAANVAAPNINFSSWKGK